MWDVADIYKWIRLIILIYSYCQLTDGTIQKVKQQYNQSGGPALEVTLAEIQEDLKLRPPQVIDLDEVQLSNGIGNGHVEQGPGSGKTFHHIITIILLHK